MVLPLNGFGSNNLTLICGWLLFAYRAWMGIIASVIAIYIGIEKNIVDGPACCSAIVAFFLLSFRKLINI